MPRAVRLAVVGDAFVDVVAGTIAPDQLPKWGGDTEVARPIELQPGGSALNTATHLAALARDAPPERALAVTLHTVVGADAFGDVLRTHLASRDVALSSPSLDGVPTGVCIVLSGTEDRSFITHYGAARAFSIEHIDQERLLDADHLHIGGFYSCTNLRRNLMPLLEAARAKGITTSLDTNYDSTEKWEGLDELLPLLDVFMPNEVEAMAVAKTDTVDAAMAYLRERVGGLTLIKIGAGGARAYCAKTQRTFLQASFKTTVVDVTGAGDSFNSGFLAAWKTSGGDVQKGLQWGCATASRCVAALGACSTTISSSDVEAVVAKGDIN